MLSCVIELGRFARSRPAAGGAAEFAEVFPALNVA